MTKTDYLYGTAVIDTDKKQLSVTEGKKEYHFPFDHIKACHMDVRQGRFRIQEGYRLQAGLIWGGCAFAVNLLLFFMQILNLTILPFFAGLAVGLLIGRKVECLQSVSVLVAFKNATEYYFEDTLRLEFLIGPVPEKETSSSITMAKNRAKTFYSQLNAALFSVNK